MRVEIACSLRSRLLGLYGRDAFDGVLLLVPCNDIHTFGMRRSIDVAFVSADGAILESHRGVAPNRRLRNRRAAATLERFSTGGAWCEPGDLIEGRVVKSATPNTGSYSGFSQVDAVSAPHLLAPIVPQLHVHRSCQ